MIFDTKEEMPKFTVTADEKARKEEVLWSNREDTMREAVGQTKQLQSWLDFAEANGKRDAKTDF